MPTFFSKVFRSRDAKKAHLNGNVDNKPREPEDPWQRTVVQPSEVVELLRGCTQEVKSRGLTIPFFLLPFRPNADTGMARTFIRQFFGPDSLLRGERLAQELRLSEPEVLCSILKWCWSRLPGGVVTWDVYEYFRVGEEDSSLSRDAFKTFIPIGVGDDQARSEVIFLFFDLLSAIAGHGKHNGLGGIKLSRLAGWWAFEHSDGGWGFEGGYVSWTRAADAACHLFFAYLRSLQPNDNGKGGIPMLPTALRALLASTDYPPVEPVQLQTATVRVALTVETVSPTPFALLRRAKNFNYRDDDFACRIFRLNDPVDGLSDECKRVLKCISNENHSPISDISELLSPGVREKEPSWSKFQDMGFTGLLEEEPEKGLGPEPEMVVDDDVRLPRSMTATSDATQEQAGLEIARPTTPSWADFMVAGFQDRENIKGSPPPLLLPPDKILPPIDSGFRVKSSQSTRRIEDTLDRGELTGVHPVTIDDAFWWVWISSLAGEESAVRKAVFGRCALVETVVDGGKWLVVEEKVKGAAPGDADALNKKDKKRSKRSRLTRRKSVNKQETAAPVLPPLDKTFGSRTTLGPDQRARIESAAAALRKQNEPKEKEEPRPQLHNRTPTASTLPLIGTEAASAMKWASKYDRDAIREQYLKNGPIQQPATPAKEEKEMPAPPPITKEEPKPAPSSPPKPAEKSVPLVPLKDEPKPKAEPPTPIKTTMPPPPPVTPSKDKKEEPKSVAPPASPQSLQSFTSNRSSMDATMSKKPKTSRFRNLFGTKKDKSTSRSTTPVPTESVSKPSTDIPPPQEPTRKLSMARKNTNPNLNGSTSSILVAVPKVEESNEPVLKLKPEAPVRPAISREVSSSVNSVDQRAADASFSTFSQGPLLDQPAFVPDSPAISVDEEYKTNKRQSSILEAEEDSPVSPIDGANDLPPPAPAQVPASRSTPSPAGMRNTPPPAPSGIRGPGLPTNPRPGPGGPSGPGMRGPPPQQQPHPALRGPGGPSPIDVRGPPPANRGPPGPAGPGMRGPGIPVNPAASRQIPPPAQGPAGGAYPPPGGMRAPSQTPQGYPPAGVRAPIGPGARGGPAAPGPRPMGPGGRLPVRGPDSAPNAGVPPPGAPAAQDRWAQIRENAARRARENASKAEEAAKNGGAGGAGASGGERPPSMEEGETSGEETIESRVARIKARVAELTGNMDQGQAPRA